MAGKRKKPIHPVIQQIMEDEGYPDLRTMAAAYKIPERGLYSLADGSGDNPQLALHVLAAEKFGVSLEEWVKRYMRTPERT